MNPNKDSTHKKKIFIANWKMNILPSEAESYVSQLMSLIEEKHFYRHLDRLHIGIAPQAPLLSNTFFNPIKRYVSLLSQTSGPDMKGSFTGEISPLLLEQLGVWGSLVGHSERRHMFHEGSALLKQKLVALLRSSLNIVYCVGETLSEKENAQEVTVIENQIHTLWEALQFTLQHRPVEKSIQTSIYLAYEPVWAIGTGKNASPIDIERILKVMNTKILELKKKLEEETCVVSSQQKTMIQFHFLYGGSVTKDNAKNILPLVDGFLVGGSSLNPQTFFDLMRNSLDL